MTSFLHNRRTSAALSWVCLHLNSAQLSGSSSWCLLPVQAEHPHSLYLLMWNNTQKESINILPNILQIWKDVMSRYLFGLRWNLLHPRWGSISSPESRRTWTSSSWPEEMQPNQNQTVPQRWLNKLASKKRVRTISRRLMWCSFCCES